MARTVRGSGSTIWGSSDEFHYAYRALTGDSHIVARVATIQPVHPGTKAGVMLRETRTAGSPHALMSVSAGYGLEFVRRTATGGSSTETSGGSGTSPRWLRLTRTGNTVTADVSSNGTSWTLVGSETITMGSTIYVGLAVTSHDVGAAATATFDNVSAP